jgi:hypothetical protein
MGGLFRGLPIFLYIFCWIAKIINNKKPLNAIQTLRGPILKMETQNSKPQHLNLVVKASQTAVFLKLIESGFKLKIKAGLSIRELFCDQLGISDDYFDNRIQTLFLDGKPVDNVNTAQVVDGARIALSAAMPGLVGAIFRKGGRYASFRDTISYTETKNSGVKDEGEIMLKFFNMIAKELGPAFLQKGIILEGKRFQDFLLRNSEDLKAVCNSIHLNDEKTDVARLLKMNWENTEIFLQVTSEK